VSGTTSVSSWLGDGPDHTRIRGMAQELGIGHRVFFPGYINGTAKILPGFDVFALSSLWEGHPLSVLEAMAAGLPIVATRVNGITETVLHGETGYVVPVGDPGSMAERLLEFITDSNLASRMGEAGRQRVLEQFSLERMLNFTESVYRDTIGRRQVGEPIGATG
jgi:glycosyltransferase involved in cell wall biosynthesis